jgi:hypothetical protein
VDADALEITYADTGLTDVDEEVPGIDDTLAL